MANVTIIQPTLQAETGEKQRVAAYCRVSSSSNDQLNSYIAQMTYYSHKFENSQTETLIDIYADEGITGTRDDKRGEFQRMMQDCRKGKIDRIYTKSISRFARNTKDCLVYLRELKSLGITVYFEKENIDTARTSDEMMITILGGLAQEESASISKNLKWSYQKRMQAGTYITSNAPFGYFLRDGMLIVNEHEAEIIREIFSYFTSGHGAYQTAEHINQLYPDGRKWNAVGILYVLTNEKYIGDSMLQKTYTPEVVGAHSVRNFGERTQYYVSGTHEAIITREQFEAAQKALALNRIVKCEHQIYPFTQRIACCHCGMHYRRKNTRNIIYWVCVNHDIAAENCPSERIPESVIEEAFIRLHNKLLENHGEILKPMIQMLLALHARRFSGNANVLNIHKEMAKLREQKHVLAKLRTKGFLNDAKYQEQTAEIERKLTKLQNQLHLLTRDDEDDEALQQIEQLADYFAKREEQMIAFEPEIFDMLIDSITANSRETLTFHLIGGLDLTEQISAL